MRLRTVSKVRRGMPESTGNRHYIQDAENKKRSPPVLDGWSSPYAAGQKYMQMTTQLGFEKILEWFSDGFQELESMVKEIRQALFPSERGKVAAESEVEEQDRLYGAFLGIIQRQLNKMSKRGQSPYLDWWRGVKVGRH
jgi:hypothetical protein